MLYVVFYLSKYAIFSKGRKAQSAATEFKLICFVIIDSTYLNDLK